MGSTSDLPIMGKAADFLNQMEIPFEINALSAHRTPEKVEEFAKGAKDRGIKVIIAAAGMAAHLPGVIASMTALPVIGWYGCFIGYSADASGYTSSNSGDRCCAKCRNLGIADDCYGRRASASEAISL